MAPRSRPVYLSIWLLTCCGMIFIMALIGAVTRLTESGLSITDWNPVLGAIPPLNESEWQRAFSAYQQIPQFKILNSEMTLDGFRHIYFWEWLHRLWGRLIGLVFAIPLIYFLARKQLNAHHKRRLIFMLMLLIFQGFVGWYMVQSGLVIRTDVSPYRLAFHLACALVLYAGIFWTALEPLAPLSAPSVSRRALRRGWFCLSLLCVTMTWGAFVAGLHAGGAYNTWPLMDGDIVPAAAFTQLPKGLNFVANAALVQFIHRWLGPLTTLCILAWVFMSRGQVAARPRLAAYACGVMATLQVCLGIATLLSHAEIALATIHQAGAIILLTLLLLTLRLLTPLR